MSVRIEHGDCMDMLPALLACTPQRALEIGKAAEHLVCADLIFSGYRAFLADQGLPFDIVVEHKNRLLRVQVKSSVRPRPVPNRPASGPSYLFHIRRAGKGASRLIGNNEFDILALVAIDIRRVAYMPIDDRVLQVIHLRVPTTPVNHGNKSRGNMDEYPFSRALVEFGA